MCLPNWDPDPHDWNSHIPSSFGKLHKSMFFPCGTKLVRKLGHWGSAWKNRSCPPHDAPWGYEVDRPGKRETVLLSQRKSMCHNCHHFPHCVHISNWPSEDECVYPCVKFLTAQVCRSPLLHSFNPNHTPNGNVLGPCSALGPIQGSGEAECPKHKVLSLEGGDHRVSLVTKSTLKENKERRKGKECQWRGQLQF